MLNEKGIPSPLAHTLLTAPSSRMDILSPDEIKALVAGSRLAATYNQVVDRESAYEILQAKMDRASTDAEAAKKAEEAQKEAEKAAKAAPARSPASGSTRGAGSRSRSKSPLEELAGSRATQTILREVTRGLLGAFLKRR